MALSSASVADAQECHTIALFVRRRVTSSGTLSFTFGVLPVNLHRAQKMLRETHK
jgi:hypothetical protein